MRKWAAVFLCVLLCFSALAGCGKTADFQDGTYQAQVADYDSNGYKDFVQVTVKDGAVTELVYDGVDANGRLRTNDATLASRMEETQGTYPKKYTDDLVNQYLEAQDPTQVDAVAGATNSSNTFLALMTALEPNMRSGDTTVLVIENVPEK